MSQPTNYSSENLDPWNMEITDTKILRRIFENAQKPKNKFMIGVEYELFAVCSNDLSPLPFEGSLSIATLFKHLMQKSFEYGDELSPIYDDGNLVALENKETIIALEPGGQLEIAAKPKDSLVQCIKIFNDLILFINQCANELGIKLLSLGFQPWASKEEMARVKKSRYSIMKNYMPKVGSMGLDMMYRTCAIQINIDYENEADMAKKMRIAAILSPMFSALFSSCAFNENKLVNQAVFRGHVWQNTDKNRTGIPKAVFSPNFSYDHWIEFVLDVPMYFIRRNEQYIDMSGKSFRDFINNGFLGFKASARDFIDHMSTIFTEVRLKPFIEFRSIDCLPVIYVNALSALIWCFFYNDKIFKQLENKFNLVSFNDVEKMHNEVIINGCRTKFLEKSLWDWWQELIALTKNSPEECYLEPLNALISNNITAADWIKTHSLSNSDNKSWLFNYFSPLSKPFL